MTSDWRYFARRFAGDGSNTLVLNEVPLEDVEITNTLSGPGQLTGKLSLDLPFLKDDRGHPLLQPWSTGIFAERNGIIEGGGLLMVPDIEGSTLNIDCMGFSGYPNGQPFLDSYYGVGVDPMDEARHVWSYLQSQPRGNLGAVLDGTTSPVRIGTELTQVEFDSQAGPVSFEAGPYKLAWWTTDDLGKEFADLAKNTPFDYLEEHELREDGSVGLLLRLGYPTLGQRRPELRFMLGENINTVPTVHFDGDAYANGVVVLGSGEGRDMVRSALVDLDDGRLRRVMVVPDKAITTVDAATTRARSELASRSLLDGTITEVNVRDSTHAPLGSWKCGDEIRVTIEAGWANVDLWVRVLSMTISPDSGDAATMTVQRSDAQ